MPAPTFTPKTWTNTAATPLTAAALIDLETRVTDFSVTRTSTIGDGWVYGLTPDAVEVTDAAITTGTATLTSASAGFTAGDVGKLMVVAGAGSAGAPLYTTITGWTNATTVTLAGTAAATVSGARARYGTDNTPVLQAAHDALGGTRGTLLIPAGRYAMGSAVTVSCDNLVIEGRGIGVTELWQMASARVMHQSGLGVGESLRLADISLVGLWQHHMAMGTDSDRQVGVTGYQTVELERVESRYSRQMGLTVGYCERVTARACLVRWCARDGLNFSICGRVVAIGNHLEHIGDDAIAVHNNTAGGNPPIEGHVIQGNVIDDAYGLKLLGMVKAAVIGNTIRRPKGYGVLLSVGTPEGENDATDVMIADNVITDLIDSAKAGGGVQRDGILVSSSTTGFVAPVVGGATPTITKPDTYSYVSNAVGAQNAGAQRVRVHGNTVAMTLPPLAAYSSWGYGQMFTAGGWLDPSLASGFWFTAAGVRIDGAILGVAVTGNTFEGMNSGVAVASTLTYLGDLMVSGNVFRRFSGYALNLETGSLKRGRAWFVGNHVDGDPLFESGNRVTGGKWSTGAQTPGAVDTWNWEMVVVEGNVFRNLNQVGHGTGSKFLFGAGTYYMHPDAAFNLYGGATTDNRGIRSPWGLGNPGSRLVWEDSDPTSTTYGQVTGNSAVEGVASSIPTGGAYVAGMTVPSSLVTESGTTPNKYTVIGWRRLTTGTAHVLNTDWRELRALTGN